MSCRICLVEHREETHAATLRVREWFRERVVTGPEPERPSKYRKANQEVSRTFIIPPAVKGVDHG